MSNSPVELHPQYVDILYKALLRQRSLFLPTILYHQRNLAFAYHGLSESLHQSVQIAVLAS
jgi:hypothetical protein